MSLSCCMGWVSLKNQIIEEKAPINWCTCSMLNFWYSDGFSVSFILIQIWSINSDLTWSQWEFCQANSGAEIIKDFGIWPLLRDYMDQNLERTNPLLSSFWASIMWFGPCCNPFFFFFFLMSKPRFNSREMQKDQGRDWSVFHWTSVSLKLVGQ